MGIPTGTVTFLFTDIEGSTRLWEDAPDAMQAALARHDEIIRSAIDGHDGYVFATGGDGFAAAFGSVGDAVGAAVDAQHDLAAEPWAEATVIRVRMGLHLGEVEERDGDYFGRAVNHTARLMATGHGGQILCSQSVADLTALTTADLGEHRLRDLSSTVRVFQLQPDGAVEFPPLRTVGAYGGNLPFQLTEFIGREQEVADVIEALEQSRLVTIVGVGGVGKTRLAMHVAAELLPHHRDGAWLVEAAPVIDPEQLPEAVAATLGYVPPDGAPVLDSLAKFFGPKQLLLVLDNCEHLLRAAAELVTAISAEAPDVEILCTSREALGVRGERAHPLPSMTLASGDGDIDVATSEAGRLFVARAVDARDSFELTTENAADVAALCRRLDGIPLALELAAARTAVMSPHEILDRLDQRFRLLTGRGGAALERHQTLRAAVDWSYDLLSGDERLLLDASSVFVEGFDLEAAVGVGEQLGLDEFDVIDHLGSLVAKSLIVRSENQGVTRYRLLETIRQYAAEQLGRTGRIDQARTAHASHYRALTARLAEGWTGFDQFEAYARFGVEAPNIVAAMEWILDREGLAAVVAVFDTIRFNGYMNHTPRSYDLVGAFALRIVDAAGVDGLAGFATLAQWGWFRSQRQGDTEKKLGLCRRACACGDPTPSGAFLNLAFEASATTCDDTLAVLDEGHEAMSRSGDPAGELALWWARALLGVSFDRRALVAEAVAGVHDFTGSDTVPANRALALTITAIGLFGDVPDEAMDCLSQVVALDRTPHGGYHHLTDVVLAGVELRSGHIAEALRKHRAVMQQWFESGNHAAVGLQIDWRLVELVGSLDQRAAAELAALKWRLDRTGIELLNVSLEADPDAQARYRSLVRQLTVTEAARRTLDLMDGLREIAEAQSA